MDQSDRMWPYDAGLDSDAGQANQDAAPFDLDAGAPASDASTEADADAGDAAPVSAHCQREPWECP